MLSSETIASNAQSIEKDLDRVFGYADADAHGLPFVVLNNETWWSRISALDMLRDVGRYFRVGTMLQRESVRNRINSDQGISFTEFSYQLLQGYDFLHLWREHDCVIQVGGSDQFGNILAGCDLIHRVGGNDAVAHAVTVPLLTTSSGEKFGKSEGNAIWLCPSRTSHYAFYQYFMRSSDEDVMDLLRVFTELDEDTLRSIQIDELERQPGARYAQRVLAETVTRSVRGEDGYRHALRTTEALFGGVDALEEMSAEALEEIFFEDGAERDATASDEDNQSHCLSMDRSDALGTSFVNMAVRSGLVSSKKRAKHLINSGGLYVNNRKVDDPRRIVSEGDLIHDRLLLLRSGKRKNCLVRLL